MAVTWKKLAYEADVVAKTLLTTKGDIIYASGASTPARLGIGSDNQVLKVNVDVPNWEAEAAGHDAVTLAASAEVLLGLSTQELSLDTQNANIVLAGPSSGAAVAPTFRSLVAADLPGVFPGRNVIINGDFDIWQRGTTFTAPTDAYTADRWKIYDSGNGVFDVLLSTVVPTTAQAGALVNYSLQIDVTTADSSIGAAEEYTLQTRIEGYNFKRFVGRYGTLSFWVRSPKTGIHCVSFRSSTLDRSYVVEYTINAADTWEFKTTTVLFDYSGGTWDYTNGIGLYIAWCLAAGSNYQTTKDSWQNGNYVCTSNQVNCLDSTANNFYLSHVQFELGSVATEFEHRLFGEELSLCQRYFVNLCYPVTASGRPFGVGGARSTTLAIIYCALPVTMRTTPGSAYLSAGNTFQVKSLGGSGTACTSVAASVRDTTGFYFEATVASGLTAENIYFVEAAGTTTICGIDAEL